MDKKDKQSKNEILKAFVKFIVLFRISSEKKEDKALLIFLSVMFWGSALSLIYILITALKALWTN